MTTMPNRFAASAFLIAASTILLPPAVMNEAHAQSEPLSATAQMQSSVDDLALQLRLTFRGRKSEFDARYATLAEALERWNQSSRTDADMRTMQSWLDDATRASIPGSGRRMPQPPSFEIASSSPPAIESLPSGTEPAGVVYDGDYQNQPQEVIQSEPAGPALNDPLAESAPSESLIEVIPEPTQASEPASVVQSEPQTDVSQQPQPSQAAKRHPGSAPINWSGADWSDPFVDDPLPQNPNSRIARTTRFKPASSSTPAVKVNLTELSARIRGYRRALSFIEADLMVAENATGFRLAGILRELDAAQTQRELLEMYLAGLSEIERMAVPDLPPSSEVLRLVKQRTEERRQALSGTTGAAAEAEAAVLDGLDRKLGQLSH